MDDDETQPAASDSDLAQQLTVTKARRFGGYVRWCRDERELSPEALAERSELDLETIHEIEAGACSASLDTLRRLCAGFELPLSALFEGFDLREREFNRELLELVGALSEDQYQALIRLLRTLCDRGE
ncbi:anaerobic benzoate catabolism transcriptional regulator [Enhygromyxa salina]|uniref:Anaerobic benzoate catabolism transcriptional regulator n=1 Tax=Enhygromyxa salina TaxID=215803 RepID=A0A2S9XDZ7_9BACT|nr:helix-turn-helix transcriptional regulator [Enhygromyxa salina]PRP91084.1 anaerobic benzoate catabolism transcriptional regulator [Enhygromyxa salina]